MRQSEAPYDLRAWRKRLDVTQLEAGKLLGLSRASYIANEQHSTTTGKTRICYRLLAEAIEHGRKPFKVKL